MVYITGDLHGDLSRLSAPEYKRLRKGDTLLVCGDFGFIWNGGKAESKLLHRLGKQKYTLAFLDGRHENFDRLSEYEESEWNGGRVQRISGSLLHLLRGEIYTIEEHRYFVFGGGESDDRDFREPGVSWWPAELPTAEEKERALQNLDACGNRVDFILTHEPSGKSSGYLAPRTAVDEVNIFLNRVEDTVDYTRWFFGCLHQDKTLSSRHRAVFRELVAAVPPQKKSRKG